MGKPIKLYFAYGMNTNPEEMKYRCPTAVPIGRAVLPGYRLAFNSFATIVPDPDSQVEGVLWTITDRDETSLDILEGYPTFYRKKTVKVKQDVDFIAMTYIMNGPIHQRGPGKGYYSMVSEGYDYFGLSQLQLSSALTLTSRNFNE